MTIVTIFLKKSYKGKKKMRVHYIFPSIKGKVFFSVTCVTFTIFMCSLSMLGAIYTRHLSVTSVTFGG